MKRSVGPAATAVSGTGVLIIGLCLITADRLNQSSLSRTLAVLAVALAAVSVVVALGASVRQFLGTLIGAAALSILAVAFGTAAALIVVLRPAAGVHSDKPEMTLAVNGGAGETSVSVLLDLPGLRPHSLVDATLKGITYDAVQADLVHVVATADDDGFAQVTLAVTDSGQFRNLMVKAEMTGRTCSVTVPLENRISPDTGLTCRSY
ncbi:hypothetical protein FB565_006482 [Actinoplanes lutulentus]|uniref:Uncharacterized protein n=1 Tax=Actinoplanes lutulentus TaxID=1287878 RepID=A0A327Z9J3_9ACTN|nr:hypothetical protein [Actinoplanes lutulentus]MBB2946714.1 hypothetical protein [Actinoplanes lutulentus]RAK35606.1 hypothetical protein B0I29_10979 [Actinoplanes lutulentus]